MIRCWVLGIIFLPCPHLLQRSPHQSTEKSSMFQRLPNVNTVLVVTSITLEECLSNQFRIVLALASIINSSHHQERICLNLSQSPNDAAQVACCDVLFISAYDVKYIT